MTRATRERIWDAVPLHPAERASEPEMPPPGEGHPLDLGHLDAATEAQVIARLLSRDFDAWSEAACPGRALRQAGPPARPLGDGRHPHR